MSEFFNTVYNQLSDSESIWLIIFHIIAWLIGLITGYFIWGRKVKRYQEHAAALSDRINLLEGKNNELLGDIERKDAQLKELSSALDKEREKNKLIENEKGDLHSELLLVKAARGEQDELILKLNNEKEGLNAQLSSEAMSYKSSINGLNADLDARTANLSDLQAQIGQLETDISAKVGKIGDLEAKIGKLEGLNANLNADLSAKTGSLGDLQMGIGKLEADMASKTTFIGDLEAKLAELEGVNANLNADINAKVGNLGSLEAKIGELEGANAKLSSDLNAKVGDIGSLEAKIGELEGLNANLNADLSAKTGSLGDLEAKIGNLENLNAGLQGDLDATVSDIGNLKAQIGNLEGELSTKANAISDLNTKLGELEGVNAKLNADIDAKSSAMASLEGNLGALNAQIKTLEEEKKAANDSMAMAMSAKPVKLTKEEKAAIAAQAADEVKGLIGAHIPMATAADKDDLKIISGIGPFIETKLNNLGIWTFEQISYFDKRMVDKVTDAIQFFPGRIERDKWIPQAKGLSSRDMSASAKARSAIQSILGTRIPMATAADKDDLKVISGVGPFIEEKLNNLGIWTYEQVSLFDKDFIDKVTDAIEFFPGRIERDNWVNQAKGLFQPK